MHNVSNIVVGKPDTSPSKPSHQAGVRQGNQVKGGRKMAARDNGRFAGDATAGRSTGINARDREPIDPRMPKLTPA
jgi:hypothetical protein